MREYWVIDPASQTQEAYARSPAGRYARIAESDGRLTSTVVADWFLRPEWLWQKSRRSVLDLLPELGISLK